MSKFISSIKRKLHVQDENGVVLVTILVIGMVITMVALSLADLTTTQYATATKSVADSNALLVAEAGIEESLVQLNESDTFPGFTSGEVFFNNETQGRGVYTTQATSQDGERVVLSTGIIYRHNSDHVLSKRTVRVSLVGTSSEGYSVYTGVGGLILGGSAAITNSDIYVQGKIKMSGSSRIGSESQPLAINVGNRACPDQANPGPSYPQTCSTQPITMPDWGSTRVYGSICATGQTQVKFPESQWNNNPPQIQAGSTGLGLLPGCVAPEVELPTYNRTAHIGRMTTTTPANNSMYDCNQWISGQGQTRTWPANLRINGTVSVSSSCDLTITGDVYITGDLELGGAARIRVAESVGGTRPVILVDGKITAHGSSQVISNSQGTNLHFVSFRSAASCNATCTSLSGTNLYNSQNLETVYISGSGSFPGTVFQAYWGKLTVSGSGMVGAAMGQTIDLSGAGNIVFGTTLASGTSTWTIRSYQQIYD